MIILGIDPGTATTGYGIIKTKKTLNQKGRANKNRPPFFQCVNYGIISTLPSETPEKRLKKIHAEVIKIIKEYQPEILAIEKLFFFKNNTTAMPVSQAKGVVLLAAAQKGVPVKEISPLEVKMAITGYGRADKKQIQKMVKYLFNLEDIPKPDDAADALAIAACCALK